MVSSLAIAQGSTAQITGTVRDDRGGISVAGGQGFGLAYQLDGATHNNPYDN